MRTIVSAILVTIGIATGGFATAGIGSAAAGVADGAALERSAGTLLSPAAYPRWHGRVCYTKCYREFVIGRRVCRRFC